MGWLLVPYRRRPNTPKPIRESVIADALIGTPENPEPFTPVEGLGNAAVVYVPREADLAIAKSVPGVLALPELDFDFRLGELTVGERRGIIQAVRDLGFTAAEIRAALGEDDGASARFLSLLAFVTSKRRKPRYDPETDTILLDGPIQGRPRPIPGTFAGGAFPTITAGPQETFTGADGTNPPNSNWTNNPDGNVGSVELISNQARGASSYSGCYWSAASFGADQEARIDVITIPTPTSRYIGPWLRLQTPGSTAADGYQVAIEKNGSSNLVTQIYRVDNGAYTNIVAGFQPGWAAGDSMGADAVGSSISCYRKPSGGSWLSAHSTTTDTTYSSGGYIGFELDDTTGRYDNAYFGDIVSASPAITIVEGSVGSEDFATLASSWDVDGPSGVQEDDVIVIGLLSSSLANETAPTGFVKIGEQAESSTDAELILFYKIAGASESGPYTFTFDLTENGTTFWCALRGVDTSNPLDVAAGFTAAASSATATTPSITTVTDDAFVLGFVSFDPDAGNDNSIVWDSPATELTDVSGSTFRFLSTAYAYQGTAGAISFSGTLVNAEPQANATVAFRPSAGAVSQAATTNRVESSGAVYQPSATVGPVSATAERVESSGAVYFPTAIPGAVGATANRVESSGEVYEPEARPFVGGRANRVESSGEVYEPSAVPGPVSAMAERVESSGTVYTPSASFQQFATAERVESSGEVYEPTAQATTTQRATAERVESSGEVYTAAAVYPQSATANLVESSGTVYRPRAGDLPVDRSYQPEWSFVLADRSGTTTTFISPQTFKLTRKLKAACEAEFDIVLDSFGAEDIGHDKIVKAYRRAIDGEPSAVRFAGQFLSIEPSGDADGNETAACTAADPFANLSERLIQAQDTYAATDALDIAESLIAIQNDRETTHLRMGTHSLTTVSRDRTYEAGKVVGEAIDQLSDVDNGFGFKIDPVDGEGAIVAAFVPSYPGTGTDRSADVRFEYGVGTRRNVSTIGAPSLPPVNSSLAFGAGEGAEQLTSAASNSGSIAEFGLRERFVSVTDVSVQATLNDHAAGVLFPQPRTSYRLTLAGPSSSGFDSVPRLFDEFDVGDTVKLYARGRSPLLQFEALVVVTEAVLVIGLDGIETLTSITVEVV